MKVKTKEQYNEKLKTQKQKRRCKSQKCSPMTRRKSKR